MDVQAPLVPQTLSYAITEQRSLIPDDAEVIDRLFAYLDRSRPTMTEIASVVAEFYLIEPIQMKSRDRCAVFAFARHMFCYLAHKYTRASLNLMKDRVGYINHTSALHGIRRIEQLALLRPIVRDDIDLLRLRLCEKMLRRPHKGGSPSAQGWLMLKLIKTDLKPDIQQRIIRVALGAKMKVPVRARPPSTDIFEHAPRRLMSNAEIRAVYSELEAARDRLSEMLDRAEGKDV